MTTVDICPLCDSQNFSSFLTCRDHTVSHESFNLIRCNACGFVLTSPRPEESDLSNYYQSDNYISHSGTKKGVVNKLYHAVRSYSIYKKYNLIAPFLKEKTILDYGCGTGEFLKFCKQKGAAIYGCDPSDIARQKASANTGSNILNPDQYKNFKTKVDVITMWHVLEHVPDFIDVLELHKSNLNSGGAIVIAVPNHKSYDAQKYREFWAAYDVPRHLWHFSATDITRLAEKINMQITSIKPMLFDAFYVSMLSEQYQKGNIANAMISGIKSNFAAQKPGFGYSSQIYVLENRF